MTKQNDLKKSVAAIVPYPAVIIGMYIFQSAWLSVVLYHIGIIIFLGLNKNKKTDLIKGANPALLILISIATCIAILIICLMFPVINLYDGILTNWLSYYQFSKLSWIIFIIYFSTIHPFLEELHWRHNIHTTKLVSITDLAFAGYHILVIFTLIKSNWLVLIFIVLTAFTATMRLIHKKLGIGATILIHASMDLAIVLAANLLIS